MRLNRLKKKKMQTNLQKTPLKPKEIQLTKNRELKLLLLLIKYTAKNNKIWQLTRKKDQLMRV